MDEDMLKQCAGTHTTKAGKKKWKSEKRDMRLHYPLRKINFKGFPSYETYWNIFY